MARNAELIRQWEILRAIDGARTGIAIAKLASSAGVHPRTIRRDLEALCKAGFPLYDEKVNGTAMWKLRNKPFRGLEETGLSVTELCALYFSKTMIATLTGAPFVDDADRALTKLERALPAASRNYLDDLPVLMKAKVTGRKKQDQRKTRDVVARAVDASLTHRCVEMGYDSASSKRLKTYVVEPLRVSYALGGIYLTAWVPEYNEIRTFSMERIKTLAVIDEHFEPRPLPADPFANSLGVHSGSPELIEIEFDASEAEYVMEREWHRSQEFEEREDGAIRMRLCVCNDRALRGWILSFGRLARVIAPASLARDLRDELQAAHARYTTRRRSRMLKVLPTAADTGNKGLRRAQARAAGGAQGG